MSRNNECWLLAKKIIVKTSISDPRGLADTIQVFTEKCLSRPEIVTWIRKNQLQLLLYKVSEECLGGVRLSGEIHREALEELKAAKHMAELLEKTVTVFEENGIDYVIFKTFNKAYRVDVDVDILIPKKQYLDAVKALIATGFYPIDDLAKTYATGLMLPGNPIVLDLHTEITILGIPYFDQNLLLRERVKQVPQMPEIEQIGWPVYSPKPYLEAVIRIAHAVIKDAGIKIDDITETYVPLLSMRNRVKELVEKEGLDNAYKVFLSAVASAAENMYRNLPLRLPQAHRILSLLTRTIHAGDMPRLVLSLGNIRYKRNAAMIGKTLLGLLTGT